MDKQQSESDAQGGKNADLRQNLKIADEQQQKEPTVVRTARNSADQTSRATSFPQVAWG